MTLRSYLVILLFWLPGTVVASEDDPPQHFVVHIETGEGWDDSIPAAEQDQFKAHSANMSRLRKSGHIVFGARYEAYGMLVMVGESLSAVQAELDADPGIAVGTFRYRVAPLNIFYPWREMD